MNLKIEGYEEAFTEIQFDGKSNKFVLSNGNETIDCMSAIKLQQTNFPPADCQVHILYDRGQLRSENDIYDICVRNGDKKERIGYIFPLQALMSRQHEFAESRVFQKYAYVAYHFLLESISDEQDVHIFGEGNFRLTDYYLESKGINIFVFDIERIKLSELTDIRIFYPSLYKYGYVIDERKYKERWNLDETIKQQKSLLLHPISSNLIRNVPNIPEIFRNLCKANSDLEESV